MPADLRLVGGEPEPLDVVRGQPRRWGFWYRLAEVILLPWLWVFTRHRWLGARHVPKQGPVILAANHLSFAEPATLAHWVIFATGRLPRYLGKDSLFRIPIIGRILTGCGMIPVHRGTSDAAEALSAAVAGLEAGECVLIYPEGTITKEPDHWPMKGRSGVARLALATGAPVIPVATWGAQNIWRRDGHHELHKRHLVTTQAGAPVDLNRWAGREPDQQTLDEMTEQIMASITELVAGLRGERPPTEVFDLRAHQQRPAS